LGDMLTDRQTPRQTDKHTDVFITILHHRSCGQIFTEYWSQIQLV